MVRYKPLVVLVSTVQPAIIPPAEDRRSGAFSSHHLTLWLPFAPSLIVSFSHLGSQDHVYKLRQHAAFQYLRLSGHSAASDDLCAAPRNPTEETRPSRPSLRLVPCSSHQV
jgi:hypothetical protein